MRSLGDVQFISEVLLVMGLPFLLFGTALQLIWALRCQKQNRNLDFLAIILPFALISISLLLIPDIFSWFTEDLFKLYSLLLFIMMVSQVSVFALGNAEAIKGKPRQLIILLLLLFGLVHAGNFTPIRELDFYIPLYIVLYFVIITSLEAVFIYNFQSPVSNGLVSMDDFFHHYTITPREADIIFGIYQGKSNQEIADSQFITLQTVKDHCSRIYQKTEVKRRSQLIALIRNYTGDQDY